MEQAAAFRKRDTHAAALGEGIEVIDARGLQERNGVVLLRRQGRTNAGTTRSGTTSQRSPETRSR